MAIGAERDEGSGSRIRFVSTASGPPSTGPTPKRKPTGGP
jgi:hypothetical protein